MVKYIITNLEDIPENLPPGEYSTKIEKTAIEEGEFVFYIKYLGKPYDRKNPDCLLPMTQH